MFRPLLSATKPMLLACLPLSACTTDNSPVEAPIVPARAPLQGELLIAQLYTSGAPPAGGADHYFSDQFIELVNASATPLDLSGVGIANVYGSAGEINPGMRPDSYRSENPDEVVMSSLWRIPSGTELQPKEFLIIAHDGANHRPFSDLDLSSADFEAYVADSGQDEDHPTVANLESEAYNGGYDWLMTVFGPSVVVVDAESSIDEVAGPYGPLPMVSVDGVLDGVDTLMDGNSEAYKRLPDAVDSGFAWHDGPYTGTALHRLYSNNNWQDTNDSTADFEIGIPDPAMPTGTDGVSGETWVELGTGTTSFESLTDGDTIAIVHGPQGGWHLDTTLWFGGFGPAGVTLAYEALNANAERVSFVTEAMLFASNVLPDDDGWHRVGDRVVLDIAGPHEVDGQELVIRVTAALDDQTWSDERRVRVVDMGAN